MKDDNCICDISDLYPKNIIICKRDSFRNKIKNHFSQKINGKEMIRLIKYRILRFFTSKRDRDINGMLNNVWIFCEPDYYPYSVSYIGIGGLLKIRKILKEMSKNIYESTSSRYPNDSYYIIGSIMKIGANQNDVERYKLDKLDITDCRSRINIVPEFMNDLAISDIRFVNKGDHILTLLLKYGQIMRFLEK